jgi:hypothetical protein
MKNGGYEHSDGDCLVLDDEPKLCFAVDDIDRITTVSQLKKEGYYFLTNVLTQRKPGPEDGKVQKLPLTFYNMWNFCAIASFAEEKGTLNYELAQIWFKHKVEEEHQNEKLEKSMESTQLLKDELQEKEQRILALELRIKKLENDLKQQKEYTEWLEACASRDSDSE